MLIKKIVKIKITYKIRKVKKILGIVVHIKTNLKKYTKSNFKESIV